MRPDNPSPMFKIVPVNIAGQIVGHHQFQCLAFRMNQVQAAHVGIQQAGGFLDDGLEQRGEIRQLADFQRNLVQRGQFARAARGSLLELGQSSAQLLDFRGNRQARGRSDFHQQILIEVVRHPLTSIARPGTYNRSMIVAVAMP